MSKLRDPQSGCPWDLEQDFHSIAPYTVEEAYEVADAIQRKHLPDLKDELGDLLFQVVFHTQMAAEINAFDFDDVVDSICQKMRRRHPHVFSDQTIRSASEQADAWEQIKANERALKNSKNSSLLDPVTMALPAIRRAEKLQKCAARVGFDWPNADPVFDKIEEELDEVKAELTDEPNQQRIASEIGDLLFACINLARHLNVDPEQALAGTNQRFTDRFQYIEQRLRDNQEEITQTPLEQLDLLWDEAKQQLSPK